MQALFGTQRFPLATALPDRQQVGSLTSGVVLPSCDGRRWLLYQYANSPAQ
jgi:hypothetical protein